jgi:hypothetical protein
MKTRKTGNRSMKTRKNTARKIHGMKTLCDTKHTLERSNRYHLLFRQTVSPSRLAWYRLGNEQRRHHNPMDNETKEANTHCKHASKGQHAAGE